MFKSFAVVLASVLALGLPSAWAGQTSGGDPNRVKQNDSHDCGCHATSRGANAHGDENGTEVIKFYEKQKREGPALSPPPVSLELITSVPFSRFPTVRRYAPSADARGWRVRRA